MGLMKTVTENISVYRINNEFYDFYIPLHGGGVALTEIGDLIVVYDNDVYTRHRSDDKHGYDYALCDLPHSVLKENGHIFQLMR